MKSLLLFFLFFISTLHAEHNGTLNIAIYGLDKKIANEKTVEKLLLKLFEKIDYLKHKNINTFFYKNEKKLIQDLKSENKKFDFLYTIPSTYIKNYELINKNTTNAMSLKAGNNKFVQYYLIANQKSKINSLADVKNKKLVLESIDALAQIWLKKIFYEVNIKVDKRNILLKRTKTYNQYKKLLDIYFNKIDLAVITKDTFETAVILNPSIKKQIKVLKKSPEIFPYVLAFFDKKIDKKTLTSHNEFVFNPKNKEFITNLLGLVKLKSVEKIKKNDFDKAHIFYKNYLKLNEKYN